MRRRFHPTTAPSSFVLLGVDVILSYPSVMVAECGRGGYLEGRAYVCQGALGSGGRRVRYANSQHPLPRQYGKGDAQIRGTYTIASVCFSH